MNQGESSERGTDVVMLSAPGNKDGGPVSAALAAAREARSAARIGSANLGNPK